VIPEVILEIFERNLVARLVFRVVVGVDLNRIIGQVHVPVSQIIVVKLVAARANVPLFVEVASEVVALHYLGQREYSDVEFSIRRAEPVRASDEEGVPNVILNHPVFIWPLILEKSLDCLQVRQDHNSFSSI